MARAPAKDLTADNSRVQIRKLHRGENVHAELPGFDVNMRNIGGITLGQGQSPHMGDINLMTDIALGFVRLPINGRSYEWSMSGVTIVLEVENATVIPGSYYSKVLQEGCVESVAKDNDHTSLQTGIRGGVAAEGRAGWRGIPIFSLFVRGGASAKRDTERTRTSEANAKVTETIVLVHHIADKLFRAGGPLGDVRRPATRDLRGPVVSAYGAKPEGAHGQGEEVPTPLVRLEATDPTRPVTGLIIVRAEKEDFVLDASKEYEAAATLLHEALKKDKAEWLQRRETAEDDLRKCVAALAALKADTSKRSTAGGNEIELFCCAFCFEPNWDRSSDATEPAP